MRGFSIEKSQIIAPKITRIVCEHFGLEDKDVCGEAREAIIVKARGFVIYLLHNKIGVTIPFLCSFFKRPKRTICWYSQQIETFINLYDSYKNDYNELCDKMKNSYICE